MYIHILYTYVYIVYHLYGGLTNTQQKKDIPIKLHMCRTAFSANHPQPNGNHEPEMLAMLLAPLAEACHLCISQSPRRHPHLHEGNVKCLPPGTCSARMEPAVPDTHAHLKCHLCICSGVCLCQLRAMAKVHVSHTKKESLEFLVSGIQSLNISISGLQSSQ